MPIKVTHQNPGLEYDENMVCEDFLNMGMLPLDPCVFSFKNMNKGVQDVGYDCVLA